MNPDSEPTSVWALYDTDDETQPRLYLTERGATVAAAIANDREHTWQREHKPGRPLRSPWVVQEIDIEPDPPSNPGSLTVGALQILADKVDGEAAERLAAGPCSWNNGAPHGWIPEVDEATGATYTVCAVCGNPKTAADMIAQRGDFG